MMTKNLILILTFLVLFAYTINAGDNAVQTDIGADSQTALFWNWIISRGQKDMNAAYADEEEADDFAAAFADYADEEEEEDDDFDAAESDQSGKTGGIKHGWNRFWNWIFRRGNKQNQNNAMAEMEEFDDEDFDAAGSDINGPTGGIKHTWNRFWNWLFRRGGNQNNAMTDSEIADAASAHFAYYVADQFDAAGQDDGNQDNGGNKKRGLKRVIRRWWNKISGKQGGNKNSAALSDFETFDDDESAMFDAAGNGNRNMGIRQFRKWAYVNPGGVRAGIRTMAADSDFDDFDSQFEAALAEMTDIDEDSDFDAAGTDYSAYITKAKSFWDKMQPVVLSMITKLKSSQSSSAYADDEEMDGLDEDNKFLPEPVYYDAPLTPSEDLVITLSATDLLIMALVLANLVMVAGVAYVCWTKKNSSSAAYEKCAVLTDEDSNFISSQQV